MAVERLEGFNDPPVDSVAVATEHLKARLGKVFQKPKQCEGRAWAHDAKPVCVVCKSVHVLAQWA